MLAWKTTRALSGGRLEFPSSGGYRCIFSSAGQCGIPLVRARTPRRAHACARVGVLYCTLDKSSCWPGNESEPTTVAVLLSKSTRALVYVVCDWQDRKPYARARARAGGVLCYQQTKKTWSCWLGT